MVLDSLLTKGMLSLPVVAECVGSAVAASPASGRSASPVEEVVSEASGSPTPAALSKGPDKKPLTLPLSRFPWSQLLALGWTLG